MKAVNNYIIITPIKEEVKPNESGLILTEKHQDDVRYRKAKVESVGNLVQGLEPKTEIYYDKHSGYGIEFKGTLYQVIKDHDVIAVL